MAYNLDPCTEESQIEISVTAERIIYTVTTNMDEESYYEKYSSKFYSSEPIFPKEHLRMQQLMNKENRLHCTFNLVFKEKTTVIEVKRDMLLHMFLNKAKHTF